MKISANDFKIKDIVVYFNEVFKEISEYFSNDEILDFTYCE